MYHSFGNTVKRYDKRYFFLTTQNKDLYTEYLSAVPTLSKPKEIMEQLKTILLWISEIKNISYELKNVPNALSALPPVHFILYLQLTVKMQILFTSITTVWSPTKCFPHLPMKAIRDIYTRRIIFKYESFPSPYISSL